MPECFHVLIPLPERTHSPGMTLCFPGMGTGGARLIFGNS